MSQASVPNAPEHHWAEDDSSAGNHRATWIVILSLLTLVGTAVMVWYVLRVPQIPQTFLASWYVANYDDSVLLDLPFAERGARTLADTSPTRGAANVRVLAPAQLQGDQTVRQASGDLVGRLRPQGSHAIREQLDVVLLYIRAYAIGSISDEGEVEAELLAENFRGVGQSGRVPLKDIFSELATLPAAAVVVLLDTSEIEHDLSLGVLANSFSKALETMLAENSGWQDLWVINSNSLLQPAHVSWRQRQTLLTAAVTPEDWGREDLDRDGWVSLGEFYERTLRFCDFHTRGQQTPLLLRGGQGLCRPAIGDANWQQATAIRLIQTVAIAEAESKEAKTQAASSVAPVRRPVVPVRTVALRPTAQESADANSLEGKPEKSDDAQNNLVNAEGAGEQSRPAEDNAAGQANESDRAGVVSFDQSPREATWVARDRLLDRRAVGQWSPIDYAPGVWNIIQRELIALDRQQRMGSATDSDGISLSSSVSPQWKQYHDLFLHLTEPQRYPAPRLSSQAAIDLLDVWRSSQWQQRKRLWERDEELRPRDLEAWKEIQKTLRIYSDATAELTWWLDLAAGVRSLAMLEKSDAMRRAVLAAQADMELSKIDPSTARRPISSHVDALVLTRNELSGELRAMTDRLTKSQPLDMTWLHARQIDHLLRSPLLRWDLRQRLEKQLDELPSSSPVIARDEELVAVWNRARQNNGDEGVSGWGYCQRLAQSHDDLLSLIHDPTTLATTASPRIRDMATLGLWGRRYQQLCQEAEALTREAEPSAFALWRLAAISGPNVPRLAIPRTVEAALVITATLDPLRVTPQSPKPLTLVRADQPERFEPLTLGVPGGAPQQCLIRVVTPAASTPWAESLQLSVENRRLDWGKLGSEGESVTLQRGGKLNLLAMATGSPGATAKRHQIELQIAVGDHEVAVSLTIEPPRPDHVDLWVTTAGQPAIERELARRSQGPGGEAFQLIEMLAVERALAAIPSSKGVPYRFWAVNQAREGRAVRARIYPVKIPAGTILRPGRLTERRFGQIPPSVRLEVLDAIRRGSIQPWAEAIAELPAALDHSQGAEPTLPSDAVLLPFHALRPAGSDTTPPEGLDVPHGFLCIFEEVVAEPGGDDPAAVRWAKSQAGGVWEKWIETTSHFIEGKASRWDEPLIEISPLRYDGKWSKLEFAVRGKPSVWSRYGIDALPLAVTAASGGTTAFQYLGPKQWELTPSEPEATVELSLRGAPQAEAQSHHIDLTIGGFPRRVNFSLIVRGPDDAETFRREDPRTAELLAIEPVSIEGEVISAEFPSPASESQSLVLLNWQDVEGAPIKVDYQHIRVSARFDAPWTRFQDFDSPESWDRAQVVLRKELGGRERLIEKYSPRAEHYRLQVDPETGSLNLAAEITDHQGLTLDLGREELDEGRYEVFARLVINGEIGAESKPHRLIVDRTPPLSGHVRRRGVVAEERSEDRNSLWEQQKFAIELETSDDLTRVSSVQFQLLNPSKTPTKLGWSAHQVDPQRGIWAAVIDAAELAEARLPDGRYFVAATSVDLAGNRQESNREYEFLWRNRPRPAAQATDSPASVGEAAAVTMLEQAKTYAVALTFTRNAAFPIRSELMGTIKVKNLPGPMKRMGSQIRYNEVPEGNYELEVTATWDNKDYAAKHSISIPQDIRGETPISVNLLPEK